MEEEARRVKPRRAHQKSRNGCSQCKSRKIKCDETKPTCSKCKHYGTTCSYLQTQPLRGLSNTAIPKDTNHSPSAIPSPPTQTSISSPSYSLSNPSPSNSTTFTMLDLELLHSWTTHIAEKSFAAQILNDRKVYLMKTTFVELAFDHPFLMHEILSMSALHLASMSPTNANRYHMASSMHHDQALSLYQATLQSLSRENCHACFACSTLLSIHICADWSLQSNTISNPFVPFSESAHIQWMKMHIGHKALVSVVWEDIREGPLSPLFKPWLGLSDTDATPLPPAEEQQIDLLSEAWASSSLPESDIEVLKKTLQTLRRMISIGSTNHAISRETATLAWITQISEEYVKLVEARLPEAMLILATYCVLLKRIAYLWWCNGIAEKLFTIVMEVLDAPEENRKWERWVRWPTEQVFGPQFPKAGEEQWEATTKCPGCAANGANCTHLSLEGQ